MIRHGVVAFTALALGAPFAAECPPIPTGMRTTQENFRSWCASVNGRVEQLSGGQYKCICDARGAGAASSASNDMLLTGYNLGVAVHNYLAAAEKRAKARKAAAEAERLERMRADSIAAEQRREAAWAKLSGEFRFSTAPRLDMRLDTARSQLGFRFDRDSVLPELSNRELMARDKGNCFFNSCARKYEMPDEQWTTPYVDLRHLARAAHLVRRTQYAAGDARESLIDQAIEVAQGGQADLSIPVDGVVLPENALDRMVSVSVDRKLVTNERMRAATLVDSLQQRRDFVAGLTDEVRGSQARDRDAALARLAREQALLDSTLAAARRRLEAAQRAEANAIRDERNRLVETTLRNVAGGGPVENCADERREIAQLRSGLPQLERTIAQMDATAAKDRADARATIARANDAGAAAKDLLLDPLKDALKAQRAAIALHAERRALIMALGPGGAKEADRFRREVNRILGQIDEMEKLRSAAEAAGARVAKAATEANALASGPTSNSPTLDILAAMDAAGLLSPLAGSLAGLKVMEKRALGPWVVLGEAFIRSFTLSADAVMDDRAAQAMRTYADRMREQHRSLKSEADEREARVQMIERQGGCIAP